ncbi:MAG: PIN domain-containing protein [Mycobacterium sp.]|nr:PIN domain-containing protein [Mycobacterium sp.]
MVASAKQEALRGCICPPSPELGRRVGLTDLSSVTLAELLFGIGALSSGRRKDALAQTLRGLLRLFEDRVLDFDTDAARHYDELAINARAAGKGFPTADGYIAAIANARGFTVATRYVAPFQAAGLTVINPWKAPQ